MVATIWKKIDLLLLIVIPIVLGLQVSAVLLAGSLLNRQTPEALAETGPIQDALVQPLEESVPTASTSVSFSGSGTHQSAPIKLEPAVPAIVDEWVVTAAAPALLDAETPVQPNGAETAESQEQQNESLEAGQQTSPEPVTVPEPGQCSCGLQDDAWLKWRDPSRFTLQVHTASSPGRLLDFARSNDLSPPLAYYRTVWGNNPIYALVIGDHPDLEAAMSAVTELTARLPKLKPWVRRFGDIQAQIQ